MRHLTRLEISRRFVGRGKVENHPEVFNSPPKRYFALAAEAQVDPSATLRGSRVFDVRAPYACAQTHSAIWRKWIGDFEEEALLKNTFGRKQKSASLLLHRFFSTIQPEISRRLSKSFWLFKLAPHLTGANPLYRPHHNPEKTKADTELLRIERPSLDLTARRPRRG